MNARKKKLLITVEQTVMIDYQFLKPKATMFNLAFFYRFDSVDANQLAAAVKWIVRNHPALATNFELDIAENDIVQKIRPEFFVKVAIEEISENEIYELSSMLIQPFNIFGKTLVQDFYYTYLSRKHEKFHTEEYKEAKKYFLKLLSPRKEWFQFPTPDHETTDTELGGDIKNPQISVAEVENAERRLRVSRNVISIAAALLALKDYCRENAIKINFLSNNRTIPLQTMIRMSAGM